MTKHLLIIFALCAAICSCSHATDHKTEKGIIIDTSIRSEVEERISSSEFGSITTDILIYDNRIITELYEDDSLKVSVKDQDHKTLTFKSFYYWQNDTLSIDGVYGLFGGSGFSIKIYQDKATLYHLLTSDEFPTLAYKEKDSLTYRLRVPCTDTKIVLSAIPDSTKKQTVYGYVEFKSEDYYTMRGYAEGQEILPRKKQHAEMRIYFKSAFLDL